MRRIQLRNDAEPGVFLQPAMVIEIAACSVNRQAQTRFAAFAAFALPGALTLREATEACRVVSFRPKALITFSTVASSGRPSADNAR
jgi:hypothetical protein